MLDKDTKVSRQHIEISSAGGKIKVSNVSQKNFLLINGIKEDNRDIEGASILQIGETTLELIPTAAAPVVPEKKKDLFLQPAPGHSNSDPFGTAPTPPKSNTPVNWASNVATAGFGTATPANQQTWAPPAIATAPSYTAGRTNHQTFKSPKIPNADRSKNLFYGIIGMLVLAGFFFFSGGKKKDLVDRGGFRKNTQIEQDLLTAQNAIKEFEARKEKLDNKAYQRAQENYIKGFRDYRQGNYARARDHFQLVLNLDSGNQLAQRYYNLSKIKFDELVQFNMIQGLSYREKRNYRLCKSAFQSVLVMIQNNPQHPKHKEATDFFKECDLALEGRY